MIKLIKSLAFGIVRLVRCAWVLAYCSLIVLAVVQLRAVILDPVAIPHMIDMTVTAFTSLNPFV